MGITRAKKKLYLLSAVARRQFGTKKIGIISRFVNEIPPAMLEHRGRVPAKSLQDKFMKGDIEDAIVDMEPNYDEPQDTEIIFKPGDRVKHSKMGYGRIVKIEPYGDDFKLTVNFDTRGKKVLSAKYAALEKPEE